MHLTFLPLVFSPKEGATYFHTRSCQLCSIPLSHSFWKCSERTVRIRRLLKDCCLMSLIGTLASREFQPTRIMCDKFIQPRGHYANVTFRERSMAEHAAELDVINICGINCFVTRTDSAHVTLSFNRFELGVVIWTFKESTLYDQ